MVLGVTFLALTLALTRIQTCKSDVEVPSPKKASELWSLNEVESTYRRGSDGAKEFLSNWQDEDLDAAARLETKASEPWLVRSYLPRPSNNIEGSSYHVLQDRSGSFPTNMKVFKIYNKRGFLAVNKKGVVYSTRSTNDSEIKFKALQYSLTNKKYTVRLLNEQHGKYIAVSCKTGKVYTTTHLQNLETVLIYSPRANGDTFQSQKCSSQGNSTFWYLGIKKDGRIKNARTASASDAGAKFLLINSSQFR